MEKKLPRHFILFGISAFIASCNSSTQQVSGENTPMASVYSEIEKAEWLLGNWEHDVSHGSSCEHWEKKNDSIYVAKDIHVINSDTVKSETARIEQQGQNLYYIPVNKDNTEGVKFALTSSDDHELIFENTTVDFPRKIKYHQLRKDSLDTWVLGIKNGKRHSKLLPMKLVD